MKYTIVTFLWGNWEMQDGGICYVHALAAGVARHFSKPYRFVVLTDHPASEFNKDITVIPFDCPNYLGNLKKMAMFRRENGFEGRIMALDLDTVVLGDFSGLMENTVQKFTTCECPYHLRWIGGGIHCFDAGFGHYELWQPVVDQQAFWEQQSRGSERIYLTMRFKDSGIATDFWQRRFPKQVVSFKSECRWHIVPEEAKLVWFHGVPRPHQCMEIEWIRDNWLKGTTNALGFAIRPEETGIVTSLGKGI